MKHKAWILSISHVELCVSEMNLYKLHTLTDLTILLSVVSNTSIKNLHHFPPFIEK